MPIYNLLEYNQIYFMTSGSLWNYYRDEIEDVSDNASYIRSFKYTTKIVGKTPERPEKPERPPNYHKIHILNHHDHHDHRDNQYQL